MGAIVTDEMVNTVLLHTEPDAISNGAGHHNAQLRIAARGRIRAGLEAALSLQAATVISGADIKPGMTILLAPGSKPFRVDGVEPFNKSESTFVLTSGAPHSESSKVVSADRWYCLLGGGS